MTTTEIPNWWEAPLPDESSARIIADSITEAGQRLTTFEVKLHRFVLAELNTHTLFSRNSASSRAIPVHKQVSKVKEATAFPVRWPKEQPGMQGADEEVDAQEGRAIWSHARDFSVAYAESLIELGVHKSVTNRLLEPFMWHTAVVTAVDWKGFYAQRSLHHSPHAQPEFAVVATMMEDLYLDAYPTAVPEGGWHTPYIRPDEMDLEMQTRCKISVARCARTSYLTHDGTRDHEADLGLYDRLLSPGGHPHASPFQHIATPYSENEAVVGVDPAGLGWDGPRHEFKVPILGNARGWLQLRHIVLDV